MVLDHKGLQGGADCRRVSDREGHNLYFAVLSHSHTVMQMFTSAVLSFFIYVLVFLRVRGNLVGHGLRTRFQWVPKSELWRLELDRDEVDLAMFNVVKRMIWWVS